MGNEPNQPAFWRPQFSRAKQLSAGALGPFLAAGYDGRENVDVTDEGTQAGVYAELPAPRRVRPPTSPR